MEGRLLSLHHDFGHQVDILGQVVLKTGRKEESFLCGVHELQLVLSNPAGWPHFQLRNISVVPGKAVKKQKTSSEPLQVNDPIPPGNTNCSNHYKLHALFHPKLGPRE